MRGHPAGILEAALGREVGRGLGQEHEHERYEDQGGQRARDEHGVPREVGQHPDRKRCGEHGTHVVAGHHDRGGVGAAAGAGELRDHGDAGGQATAQTQAREEAQDPEPQDGRGERGGEREHREHDHGADEHFAPTPAVREVAHAQGADHHAEQAGGRDRGGLAGGHPPRLVREQGGHHGAEHHGVETVQGRDVGRRIDAAGPHQSGLSPVRQLVPRIRSCSATAERSVRHAI